MPTGNKAEMLFVFLGNVIFNPSTERSGLITLCPFDYGPE